MGEKTLELEEITGALLSFNQRKKANDESSQGEGLVSKGNQEHRRNKSRSELSKKKISIQIEEKEGYLVLQGRAKGAHKTRMCRMEEMNT